MREQIAREDAQREREIENQRRAQAVLDGISVTAGQTFILRTPAYDDDYGDTFNHDEILLAERDLDAKDYLAILNGEREGLVRVLDFLAMAGGDEVRDKIMPALSVVGEKIEEVEDEPGPI